MRTHVVFLAFRLFFLQPESLPPKTPVPLVWRLVLKIGAHWFSRPEYEGGSKPCFRRRRRFARKAGSAVRFSSRNDNMSYACSTRDIFALAPSAN